MSDKQLFDDKAFQIAREKREQKLISTSSRSDRLGLVITWIRQGTMTSKELGDLVSAGVLSP